MSLAAFTVDVDRDVNIPSPGMVHAASNPAAEISSPRFTSSREGLEIMVGLLDDLGIRGTFFMEARTAMEVSRDTDLTSLLRNHEVGCHGFDHEDLTGEDTGIPIPKDDVFFILEKARESLEETVGRCPKGFRAPYLHVADDILDAVQEIGFSYDSSLTRDISDCPTSPWRLSNGLLEVPLAIDRDADGGRMYSYLWAMHEGQREPDDYLRMMGRCQSGFLVLATHSWHLVETYSKGKLEEEEIERNVDCLRSVLEGGIETGVEFLSIEDFITRYMG